MAQWYAVELQIPKNSVLPSSSPTPEKSLLLLFPMVQILLEGLERKGNWPIPFLHLRTVINKPSHDRVPSSDTYCPDQMPKVHIHFLILLLFCKDLLPHYMPAWNRFLSHYWTGKPQFFRLDLFFTWLNDVFLCGRGVLLLKTEWIRGLKGVQICFLSVYSGVLSAPNNRKRNKYFVHPPGLNLRYSNGRARLNALRHIARFWCQRGGIKYLFFANDLKKCNFQFIRSLLHFIEEIQWWVEVVQIIIWKFLVIFWADFAIPRRILWWSRFRSQFMVPKE